MIISKGDFGEMPEKCWKMVNVARGEYGTMLDNHHQPQTDQPGLGATTTAPITGRNFVVRPPDTPNSVFPLHPISDKAGKHIFPSTFRLLTAVRP